MPFARKLPTRRGVLRLAAVFILLAAVSVLLDRLISTGLQRIPTSGQGVWNRIVGGDINAEILITGSSRALNHFDPRPIGAHTGRVTYNIGLNGSQTDMQLARLRTYLQHNRKPLLLVHNLDLFSLQVTHGEVYDPGQYVPYLRQEPLYWGLSKINGDVWKSRYLPLYGYAVEDLRFTWIAGMLGFFGWYPAEDHIQGYLPQDRQWTGDFQRLIASQPTGVHVQIEPAGVRALEDLVRLCRTEEIPLLLVYSPEYREMQSFTTNRDELFGHFQQLSERFQVPLWDYSKSVISQDRSNFYNSQHLNRLGASAFSTELAGRIATEAQFGLLEGRRAVAIGGQQMRNGAGGRT